MGIDIGGTFGKAALFDSEGKQIAVSRRRTEVSYEGGRAERDMNEMCSGIFEAIRETVALAGVAPEEIAAVGLSGHGKGLYLLDRNRKPFTAGILSTDNRAESLCERFSAGEAGEYVRKHNYQKILACQPVCILRWLKENDPAVYGEIGTVFSAKDYIRFCLTGKIQAEITDLSGTNLLNLETKNYDGNLLRLFGIEETEGCLPPIISSFDVSGGVTEEAARATGLLQGTPVCGGMFDIDACGLASGMISPDVVTMIAGTWAINEFISPKPIAGTDAPMNSLYCMDGYYLAEECSPTSAGNLQWWLEEMDGSLTYRHADLLVEESSDTEELFFLPYATGSAWGSRANGVLTGLTARCKKGDVLRAVFEGIALNAKMQLENLLRFRGLPACVRLAGGITKSEVWVRIFADILGYPVEIPEDGDRELGCFGAAIAAGTAAKIIPDVKTYLSSLPYRRITPDPAKKERYRQKYARYLELLHCMKTFWDIK